MEGDPLTLVVHSPPCFSEHDGGGVRGIGGVRKGATETMNCSEFRRHYEKYMTFPLPREVWDTDEYSEWNSHLHNCTLCSDWHLLNQVRKWGASVDDYPCVHMAYHATFTCEEHSNLNDCS